MYFYDYASFMRILWSFKKFIQGDVQTYTGSRWRCLPVSPGLEDTCPILPYRTLRPSVSNVMFVIILSSVFVHFLFQMLQLSSMHEAGQIVFCTPYRTLDNHLSIGVEQVEPQISHIGPVRLLTRANDELADYFREQARNALQSGVFSDTDHGTRTTVWTLQIWERTWRQSMPDYEQFN